MGVLRSLFSKDYYKYMDDSGPRFQINRRGGSKIFMLDYVNPSISHIGEVQNNSSVRRIGREGLSWREDLRVS